MTQDDIFQPVVRELPREFSIELVFEAFASRPGCLWFDSVPTNDQKERGGLPLARYSFLMSDPVKTLSVQLGDENPWPTIQKWCSELQQSKSENLPPMQGGIAGLIGYEAASWLEAVPPAKNNDLPTPAVSLGLYDWVIATDHHDQRSWLISQGFSGAPHPIDDSVVKRTARAIAKANKIEAILAVPCKPTRHASAGLRSEARTRDRVTSNFTSEAFRSAVEEIVDRIRNGDSFQVNLAQRLLHPAVLPSSELYHRLRSINPAPYSVYYHGEGFDVLSCSPESFLKVADGTVETRPIKGTVPRTGDNATDERYAEALLQSKKDRAENIMIVDLMRNDLSRVCEDDSVEVLKLCGLEKYQFVQHLVSIVQGRLRPECSVVDLLKACFPGGSITGAPKIEAMRTIAELEPHTRGAYCGSMGYISCTGHAEFNILIRTLTASAGQWQIPVGGGVTARSIPEHEEAETWTKAEGMLRAIP